jgi:uncharacterized protein (TIGR02284 family)
MLTEPFDVSGPTTTAIGEPTPAHEIVEILNELVQLDYDAMQAYEHAIDRVEDDEVADDLEAFLADHQRHVDDLAQLVRELGGEPIEPHRDLKGLLLEGLTALRSATGTKGVLAAMRTAEKLMHRTYTRTLAQPLPSHVCAVVAVHAADEQRHLAAIEMHLDRLSHHAIDERALAEEADRADKPHVRM